MNASRGIGGLNISVPPALGAKLAAEARRLGMTPMALATELLPPCSTPPRRYWTPCSGRPGLGRRPTCSATEAKGRSDDRHRND